MANHDIRPFEEAPEPAGKAVVGGVAEIAGGLVSRLGEVIPFSAPANDGQAGSAPRYAAFISYSHKDDKEARWLHRALETYRVPRTLVGCQGDYGPVPRRVGAVFRDEEELSGAAELGPKLYGALKDSGALIVIASTTSAKSYWVDQEIRYFKRVNPDRPVLAVIADGVPGSETEECFPQALRYGVTPDGELDLDDPSEPLAPDLTKLDKGVVKLKLIAGLLGVGYNDLVRRDLKRARRKQALLGSLSLAIMLVLASLSIAALTYARMAVSERNRAEEQTLIAQKNAREAEEKYWMAQQAAAFCQAAPGAGPLP